MKGSKLCATILLLVAMRSIYTIGFKIGGLTGIGCFLIGCIVFIALNVRPFVEKAPTKQIHQLACGCELLRQFLITTIVNTIYFLYLWIGCIRFLTKFSGNGTDRFFILGEYIVFTLIVILLESVIFWNGMIRVYVTSVQLGIKHRILAVVFAWIPIANIWYLLKIIRITSMEVEYETDKYQLNNVRVESEICKTKYPVLLVHGVFFRDFRYLNYWGRIPKELMRNGATIFYGQQQSAASVQESGRELAHRIKQIIKETGCDKVNIIAHSKGGLDSRVAITHFGMAPYVATLTTMNTPHRGCIFAEYLLGKVPEKARQKVAAVYNATLRKLGDENPDFLAAVTDLTESACRTLNETTPDSTEVLYESYMSYCKRAQNGRFPLNMTYPIVKHFDGLNDGLVSLESAKWGSQFTEIEPKGNRGISHADMIDLNRENIADFDVREYYVSIVASLKQRGY